LQLQEVGDFPAFWQGSTKLSDATELDTKHNASQACRQAGLTTEPPISCRCC